jgi:hypothetical protein
LLLGFFLDGHTVYTTGVILLVVGKNIRKFTRRPRQVYDKISPNNSWNEKKNEKVKFVEK